MSGESRVEEIKGLIPRLKSKGQLSPTLILRALCEGDLVFFDAVIGALAGATAAKARPFIFERGAGGLRMIFRNTGLPTKMFRAVNIAIDEINRAKRENNPTPPVTIFQTALSPGWWRNSTSCRRKVCKLCWPNSPTRYSDVGKNPGKKN